jgi:predicted glycoside hydrolase/deacetylase ChbG (UPF0249 family)
MSTIQLIINADDFGETDEITKGILEGMSAGLVTSTTILANMPGTKAALSEAARLEHRISFGVHLNLCEGQPLTVAGSLVREDGTFYPKRIMALRAIAGLLDLEGVEKEFDAQISRVLAGGVQISHIDSHKHLHQLPGVRNVVVRLARKFGIERIRCTLENGFWQKGLTINAQISRLIRRNLARKTSFYLKNNGLRCPRSAFDVRELINRSDIDAKLAFLRQFKSLSEMYCHPGTAKADLDKPGSCSRHDELQFLQSTEFNFLMKDLGIQLKTFWDC